MCVVIPREWVDASTGLADDEARTPEKWGREERGGEGEEWVVGRRQTQQADGGGSPNRQMSTRGVDARRVLYKAEHSLMPPNPCSLGRVVAFDEFNHRDLVLTDVGPAPKTASTGNTTNTANTTSSGSNSGVAGRAGM
jgi:hypothetical protein